MILLAGGALILFFSLLVRHDLPLEERNHIIWALIIGGSFIFAGLLFIRNENAYQWCENKLADIGYWLGVTSGQVVLLILSPSFAILTIHAAGFGTRMHSPFAAVTTWILGIACAVCGSWQWKKDEKKPIARTTIFWLVCVTLFALVLRGIGTEQIPILLTGDEGSAGISAVDFVRGEWNNIFITGWFSFPSFFSFIQSLSIRSFGQTTEALRLLSAFAGALTVGAVYLCGREMFSPRAGLLTALFLSTQHFHIHFSRLGINNIWDGLWFVITIGALWYGWKNDRRSAYLLAGIGLGFAQYFYTSSRALIAILLMALVMGILFARAQIRQALPHFLTMVTVAIVIVAPLAWFYVNEPTQFLASISRVSIFRAELDTKDLLSSLSAWKTLFRHLATGMEAYTHTALIFWYAPETPLLRPMAAALFYIGCAYLILSTRDSRLVLLTLWLLAFGVIGALSDFAPAAQRYVAAAPACALIVGYGLDRLGNTLEKLWKKAARFVTILVFLFMAFMMTSDLYFYFIEYTALNRIDNINSNGMIAQELANYLKDKPTGTTVAFFGTPNMGYYSIPSTRYLSPHVTGVDVTVPWKSFDRSQLTSDENIFVFLPEREDEIPEIRKEYPGCKLESHGAWNGEIIFWTYDCSWK